FHLRFAKAEKLKRTATVSKYVRQIFSAMKPVYTDLGSEVQRSLGFYTSSGAGRQKGFSKIIVFGGGMKLKGVAKYLQQTLGVPVIVPDSFEKLKISEDVSSAKFHENITDYGVAYGLAVQLLGQSNITSNLLPRRIARAMAWTRKGRIFTVAASLLFVITMLGFLRVTVDAGKYKAGETYRSATKRIIDTAVRAQSTLDEQIARSDELDAKVEKQMVYFDYRDVIPVLAQRILSSLPNEDNNKSQAELYRAFAAGDVNGVKKIDRQERKQLFITGFSINYSSSIKTASFKTISSGSKGRGYRRSTSSSRESDYDDYEDDFGYGGEFGEGGGFSGYDRSGQGMGEDQEGGEVEDGPGFVVTIEGFSPYAEIVELLDPSDVGTDQSKWGFVTRLQNFDTIFENCQFELFKKKEVEHFKQKTSEVDLASSNEMPSGIGIQEEFIRV
ncbi:MAG: pilus assembly protein PilM, partial [Planctomycetes bacterium]|nr:pilus assembly protein PilM [Planctomycetota bacterium]